MEFKLPELGENVEGGDIINIMVSKGESVIKEQPIMEIETDKAVIELPAPIDGLIKELHVENGDSIIIGQLLVTFDTDGNQPSKSAEQDVSEPEAIAIKEVSQETVKEIKPEEQASDSELGSDNSNVISISREEEDSDNNKIIIPASPSVRRLAREIGVEITNVDGSGPGGRITENDVKEFAKSNLSTTEAKKSTTAKITQVDQTQKSGGLIEEMNKVRVLTADRLTQSWKAPHVTQHDKADITELEKLRKQYGDQVSQAGGKLTMTSIVTKITSQALVKFPKFNCSIDMENHQIINNNNFNIGIAVDTDRGLLVPVIKNADKKNITEISVELSDISQRSRNKKIKVDELQGSTFTITNLGGIGGTYFTPVINFPNVAILGLSRSTIEPVYTDGEFKPRLMMPLSLSYDHRIIDGADAIRFLRWIIEGLENPFFTLLNS
ncbi:MAG: branched-chain alpha-keto acid dehydrogenase subunit E2 [Deltaproteobacteria bacterium]|nr:MAG: branched-chain alpha-keto acid dehydrogenase subunit E2 [Deltaproteobacteria bacterium]